MAIASVDIAGPYQAGVGTAYHGLALALAEADTGDDPRQGDLDRGTAGGVGSVLRWAWHRVRAPPAAGRHVWYGRRPEASFACYQWLKANQRFDVIHFHEWLGLSYYSVLAKRQGLAFEGCNVLRGHAWTDAMEPEGYEVLLSRSEDLVVDFMERQSVARAIVVSPSRYLLSGWRMMG